MDKTTFELQQHTIEYLQEQFTILYKAVGEVSTDRKAGDRLNFRIRELEEQNINYAMEKDVTDRKINELIIVKD